MLYSAAMGNRVGSGGNRPVQAPKLGNAPGKTEGATKGSQTNEAAQSQAVEAVGHQVADSFGGVGNRLLDAMSPLIPDKMASGARDSLLSAEVIAHRAVAHAGASRGAAGIVSGTRTADTLSGMPRADQVATLKDMSKPDFLNLQAAQRSGAIKDPVVQMGVSVETLARTTYGKSESGAKGVALARSQHAEGNLNYASNASGTSTGSYAFTDGNGHINLDKSLSRSPEAGAAFIAHEAHHAGITKKLSKDGGDRPAELNEETTAHAEQSKAWKDLKGNAGALPKDLRESLDGTLANYARGGSSAIKAQVAAHYASEHVTAYWGDINNNTPRAQAADSILTELAKDPKAQAAMTTEQATDFAKAMFNSPYTENPQTAETVKKAIAGMPTAAQKAANAEMGWE